MFEKYLTKAVFMGLFRHVLGFAGMYLMAAGYVDDAAWGDWTKTLESVVGGVFMLYTLYLSAKQKVIPAP